MQERHPPISALNVKPERTAERTDFYHRLNQKRIAPLWESLADLVPLQPRPSAVPVHWSYEDIRPLLMEAGSVITAKQAERRVLMRVLSLDRLRRLRSRCLRPCLICFRADA